MLKAIASVFIFDRSSSYSSNIELFVAGVQPCDILPLVTCPIHDFAQRTPCLAPSPQTNLTSTKNRVMSGLTSRVGIGSAPSTFRSAVDMLRRAQIATSHSNTETSLIDHGDTVGDRSPDPPLHQPVAIEATQREATSTGCETREDDLEIVHITRLPYLPPYGWITDPARVFANAQPKYDEKSWGLLTMRDAGRSQPGWSTGACPGSEGHTFTLVEVSHVDDPRDYGEEQRVDNDKGSDELPMRGDELPMREDELPMREDELNGPVPIIIASKESQRVISINSTSDTSTQRSSIWDQDRIDDQALNGNESDLTDISGIEVHSDTCKQDTRLQLEPTDKQELPPRFSPDLEEGRERKEPDTSSSASPNPYEPPNIRLPALRDAGAILIRSPNPSRFSHAAVLPLHVEKEHLGTENASLSDQLDEARAEIAKLARQNVTLSSALDGRDSPVHEVQELLNSYEQLQIENKDIRSQNLALQDDKDCLKHENRVLQHGYTAIGNHNSKLSRHHSKIQKVLEEAHAFIVIQRRRAESLRAELKSARHQTAQRIAEKEAVEGELATTQRDLKTTAEKLAATAAKANETEITLGPRESRLAATQHQLLLAHGDLGAGLRDLSARQEELTATLTATQYEVTTMQGKLTATEDQLVSSSL